MQFLNIFTSAALLLTVLCFTALPGHAQGSYAASADEVILQMAQAYKQRDRQRLSDLLPQVRGTLLEPWAAYWELSIRLDVTPVSEIQDFMSSFRGTYQEDRLRGDWLLQLGRNRDWVNFSREYPKFRMNDDRSIACYALWAEHVNTGVDVQSRVADNWLALRDADEGCASVAKELIYKDKGSPMRHVAWLRARLGIENDRPRIAMQAVELLDSDWRKILESIYSNPEKYLDEKFTALRTRTRELVSLALIRQAYLDPQAAAVNVEKLRWRLQLTAEERSWVWSAIGKRAAQRQLPQALGYFAHAQTQFMHDDHLAWMARAALRDGAWPQVQEAIEAMPQAQRSEPVWVYWRARALLQQAPSQDARQEASRLLQSIASVRGFYEQLAQEELGLRIYVPSRPAPLTQEEKESARKNPGLLRALHAMRLGLRPEGVREWNYTTNLHVRGGMDDRSLLAAADFACKNEVWDRCISASERTKGVTDFEQRFPMPFRAKVIEQAKKVGLDPAYVYGIIRQESRFVADIRSSVGAVGLMQVMPATARWTAKKLGMAELLPHHALEGDTNIMLGSGYLKLVLDTFEGSMPLATAAYNAGPSRSRAWRSTLTSPSMEAAIWVENIPFLETRDYVKKVLTNTTSYAALLSGQPQSLKLLLGNVQARNSAATQVATDLP